MVWAFLHGLFNRLANRILAGSHWYGVGGEHHYWCNIVTKMYKEELGYESPLASEAAQHCLDESAFSKTLEIFLYTISRLSSPSAPLFYQLAFFTPGMLPARACILKLY